MGLLVSDTVVLSEGTKKLLFQLDENICDLPGDVIPRLWFYSINWCACKQREKTGVAS